MKWSNQLMLLVSLSTMTAATSAGVTGADAGSAPAFTQRVSDEDLLARQQGKRFTSAIQQPAPAKTVDIRETSDFLAFNGLSTLVPKGAVLHVPERLRENIVAAPAGKLCLWREFLVRNPAWLSTLEVTIGEASGAKAIDPERMESAIRSGSIIVAVICGNPISVHKADQPPSEP